jgi:hypothetical protein
VGVDPSLSGAFAEIEALGFPVVAAGVGDLAAVDVWMTTSYAEYSEAERASLLAFVEGGGGVVSGGHAWWWASQRGADGQEVARSYPGNLGLTQVGLAVSAETVSQGVHAVGGVSADRHGLRALEAVEAHLSGARPLDGARAAAVSDTVLFTLRSFPMGEGPWFLRVEALYGQADPVIPTPDAPIVRDEAPIPALVVGIGSVLGTGLPPDRVFAVPSAFPGPVGAAGRQTVTARVVASYAGMDRDYAYANAGSPLWLATGAYAPPGELLTVTVPESWVNAGLRVQVGAHTDRLWHLGSWSRHPEITRSFLVDAARVPVASGFGGPVYLAVPAGVSLGEGEVRVEGGVPYARFVPGQTTNAAFRAALATTAAPLAEVEARGLVQTYPTADLPADLDAEALAAYWADVLDHQATLAALPGRVRDERLAMDVQISAGWMHSGYPIMAYQNGPALLDLARLRREGDWGMFHELGHNHQFGPANLPGTTECTVNLWSAYTMQAHLARALADAHPALTAAERAKRIDAYVAGGRDFAADWNVWTCLETMLQLEDRFGWDLFVTLHEQHRALPAGQRPDTDAERIDDWVRRTSRISGRDLTGFYRAWGWPVTGPTAAAVADLPPWTDHPMAGR